MRAVMRYQHFLLALLLAFVAAFAHATPAKRLALLIGNDAYQHISKLEKAGNDAVAMARELKAAGFEVELLRDVNYRNMTKSIEAFTARINGGDQVLVFYAGHGVQIKSGNYLLPIDLEKGSESEIERFSYSLDDLTAKLAEAKASFSLVIIDACRNNPIKVAGRSVGASRGLSAVEPPKGQMVVFSASRGQEALDKLNDKDTSPNGVFTRELIARMKTPGIKIQDLMVEVQDAVEGLARSVDHDQRPAMYNESRGNFYFYGSGTSKITINTPASNDPEIETWNAASGTNSLKAYQAYLKAYPAGRFSAAANIKVDALQQIIPAVIALPFEKSDAETALWLASEQSTNQRLQKINNQVLEKKQAAIQSGRTMGSIQVSEVIRQINGGKVNEQKVIEQANIAIKEIAQKSGISLVLQDAFWVSPKIDITDHLIQKMQAGVGASHAVIDLPQVKFAFLNKDLLRSSLDRRFKNPAAVLEAALSQIPLLADKIGFNAVATDAVWVDVDIDITSIVIAKINDQPLDYSLLQKQLNKPVKPGFVSVDRLLRETAIAKRVQNKLESEFKSRELSLQESANELRKLVAQLESEKGTLSESQLLKLQQSIQNENSRFAKNKKEFQDDLNARRNEELAMVIKVANRAVRELAQAQSFSIIVQDAVYVDSGMDITSALIKHSLMQ